MSGFIRIPPRSQVDRVSIQPRRGDGRENILLMVKQPKRPEIALRHRALRAFTKPIRKAGRQEKKAKAGHPPRVLPSSCFPNWLSSGRHVAH
jgi:hypothetical protein